MMTNKIDVEKFKEFADKIGITFTDITLIQQALTHRSYLNEHRDYPLDHNERLEFLGDAVLELVVTRYLFDRYKNPEGELTSWRSALVCGEMLAKVSQKIGVDEYLLLSRGEAKDTGRARQYLLANACESIIGAVYLDQGYDAAKTFISDNIIVYIDEVLKKKLYVDPKSHFQEKAQEKMNMTPKYKSMSETGPDHDKHFLIAAYVGDEFIAEGEGQSKQEAQREAARNALEKKGWL